MHQSLNQLRIGIQTVELQKRSIINFEERDTFLNNNPRSVSVWAQERFFTICLLLCRKHVSVPCAWTSRVLNKTWAPRLALFLSFSLQIQTCTSQVIDDECAALSLFLFLARSCSLFVLFVLSPLSRAHFWNVSSTKAYYVGSRVLVPLWKHT